METAVSSVTERRAARIVTSLSAYAVAGGALALIGWAFNLRRLADWDNDGVAQLPNNALGVIAAGAGLMCCASFGRRAAGRILGVVAALIAFATLFEQASGADLGIDTLILYRPWGQAGTVVPGRMGFPGAAALAIIGLGIVSGTFDRTRRVAIAAGLMTIAISMLSVIGYLFHADPLYAIPHLTTIALQTSTMLLAIGVALVASVPETMPARLLLERSAGALLARRALPAIVLLPMLLGWLAMLGGRLRFFDAAFGTALLVLTLIIFLLLLLFWSAAAISGHERALRENRDRLAGIVGSITDAFMTVDATWRLIFVNEEAESVLGRSGPALAGTNLWDVLPAGEDGPHEPLRRAMSERKRVEYEVFYPALQRWFANRAYPTADGGLAVYARDVTRRKAAEEALRETDRLKDEFLATLSHELRTPLTSIVGWSHVLLNHDTDPDEQRQALEAIRASAHAQARLVEDVLDVSRIMTGNMRLERKGSDLAAIVEAATTIVRPAAEAKRIAIRLKIDAGLPRAFVDPVRMQQVVWNLLSNAIKFSPHGSAVYVAVCRDEDSFVIEVTDTGSGIRREFLPHLFERFRQADSSPSRSHGGLGLGLALTKDLVELHGGSISVDSEEGRGSRVKVRLPLPEREAVST